MSSRRALLGGTLLASSLSAQSIKPAQRSVDIIVIGSGAAGLCAAIQAKKSGASVLLLEKMASVGGNSIISEGIMAIPQTPMQKSQGLSDSPELFAKDLLRLGYINSPDKVRLLSEQALPTFNWLQRELGIGWHQNTVEYDYGHSVRRCAILYQNSGMSLIYPLFDRARSMGVTFMFKQHVTTLIEDELTGRITGVRLIDQTDEDAPKTCIIKANQAVILCSGGFGADIELRQMQNWRLSSHVGTTTQPGSTSEMLREAARVGAWLKHLQYIHCIADTSPDEKGWGSIWKFNRYCAASKGVWIVQETGKRFVNETDANDVKTNAILDCVNEGHHCLCLADANAVAKPRSAIFTQADVLRLVARGYVQVFGSLQEVSQAYTIPWDALKTTINQTNTAIVNRSPTDAMGRVLEKDNLIMSSGPWYVARLLPKVLLCGGGIVTNTKAQVLHCVTDQPIAGFFAAGEVTGGLHGISRLSSCGLLDAIIFGRIAGENATRARST